jgi:hypothetical protein
MITIGVGVTGIITGMVVIGVGAACGDQTGVGVVIGDQAGAGVGIVGMDMEVIMGIIIGAAIIITIIILPMPVEEEVLLTMEIQLTVEEPVQGIQIITIPE